MNTQDLIKTVEKAKQAYMALAVQIDVFAPDHEQAALLAKVERAEKRFEKLSRSLAVRQEQKALIASACLSYEKVAA